MQQQLFLIVPDDPIDCPDRRSPFCRRPKREQRSVPQLVNCLVAQLPSRRQEHVEPCAPVVGLCRHLAHDSCHERLIYSVARHVLKLVNKLIDGQTIE